MLPDGFMRTRIVTGSKSMPVPARSRSMRRTAIIAAFIVALLSGRVNQNTLSAAEGPQLAVYVMNADGTDVKKLVQAPGKRWHAAPSWSNDGKFVVFHAHPMDASTADSHVFVVKADGTDIKDLGGGAFAA